MGVAATPTLRYPAGPLIGVRLRSRGPENSIVIVPKGVQFTTHPAGSGILRSPNTNECPTLGSRFQPTLTSKQCTWPLSILQRMECSGRTGLPPYDGHGLVHSYCLSWPLGTISCVVVRTATDCHWLIAIVCHWLIAIDWSWHWLKVALMEGGILQYTSVFSLFFFLLFTIWWNAVGYSLTGSYRTLTDTLCEGTHSHGDG